MYLHADARALSTAALFDVGLINLACVRADTWPDVAQHGHRSEAVDGCDALLADGDLARAGVTCGAADFADAAGRGRRHHDRRHASGRPGRYAAN